MNRLAIGSLTGLSGVLGPSSVREAACQLQVLFLVLAYGHEVGVVDQDVHGHQGGVGQQTGVDTLVGLIAYDFLFYLVALGMDAQGLARLVLERGGAHQLADAHVHVHQQIHLRNLGHVALDVDGVLVGVEAGGQVFRQDVLHVLVQHLRVGMRGEGVEVGHEVTAVVVVLHAHEVAQGAVIVA